MNLHTILLVDDDEDDREFFKIALKKCGASCQLFECVDGEKLILYLKNKPAPDYIFLDINMPKINGIECLKVLAENKIIAGTKIIMQSTAAAPIVVDQCFEWGAMAYIVKPDNTGVLEHMIKYCLEKLDEKLSRDKFILNNFTKTKKNVL